MIEDNPADVHIDGRALGDAGAAAVETAPTAEQRVRAFKQAEWVWGHNIASASAHIKQPPIRTRGGGRQG
jgi:hypothetical protein